MNTKQVALLLCAVLLSAAPAFAHTETRVDTLICACDSPSTLPAEGISPQQVECSVKALSINVAAPGWYRVCYNVFGNSWTPGHDGVNAWITGPPDQPIIAAAALAPGAVGRWRGASGISACENVDIDTPFTATFTFAFFTQDGSINEHFGCGLPKMPLTVPSWLTVEPLP